MDFYDTASLIDWFDTSSDPAEFVDQDDPEEDLWRAV